METLNAGVATFSNLFIDQAGNGFTLLASSTVNGTKLSVTSNAFNITPANASQVAFTLTPASGTAGQALSTVTAAIEDKFGNVETGDTTDEVTLSVKTGPGGFTSGSTTTATVSDSVATFNNLVLDTAGTYTLSAASGSLTAGASNSIVINPATATQMNFTAQPTYTTAGDIISPAVTVSIEDNFGNVETGDTTDTVQLSFAINLVGGSLNGKTSAQVVDGVATFSNLSIDKAANGYAVLASSPTSTHLTQATSNDFNITPAAATQMVFTQQPTDTAAGATISPSVTVSIEDQFGNLETGDNSDKVNITIGTKVGGGTLSGTPTQQVVKGVATFGDLSIDNAGNGYTLTASSIVGTTPLQVTSNPFNITSSGPTNISGDLNVTIGGHRLVSINGKRYVEENVTITNISSLTFNAGMTMVLSNLSSNASLYNTNGTYQGNPFIDISTPTGGLGPNQSMTVYMIFNDPSLQNITFDTTEYEGEM